MRNLIALAFSFLLIACGTKGEREEAGPPGEDGVPCIDVSTNSLCKFPDDDEEVNEEDNDEDNEEANEEDDDEESSKDDNSSEDEESSETDD